MNIIIEIKNRIWWLCDCVLEFQSMSYQQWRFEEAMNDIGKYYRNNK